MKLSKNNLILILILLVFILISKLFGSILLVVYIWKRTSWSRNIKVLTSVGLMILLLLPLASAYGIFPIRPLKVSGISMEPNLKKDAYILARTYFPNIEPIKRGEIVVHKFVTNKNYSTIRRVIGLPGEVILIEGGKVYINNKPIDETEYLSVKHTTGGQFIKENSPMKIPSDSFVVLTDNRGQIDDSRKWGFIKRHDIENKYLFCYYKC